MKTFNELIQQLIEMRKDERNGKLYRKRTTASHICDEDQLMLDGEFTTAVLPDLDGVLNMSHQIYRDNWYNERRKECTLDYFIVKTFLEADTDKKEEMIKDSRICDCLLCARKCFNRFIPCSWWKRIVDNAKEKRSFLDRLQLVEDFDNPTDEEIIHCLALSERSTSAHYDECLMVFGQNRTIPLIIKRLEDILTKVETFEIAYTDAQHLSNSELISIYKGLSDEAVKKMKLISGDSYTKMAFQLFQEDPRWLIKVPSQRDYVAIKDFVDKNGAHIDLSDRTKACFLVNKCCEDRGFPEYILRRIKLFVPMIKMYSFNYKDVCPMMMECFNEDGSFKTEILEQAEALAKGERADKAKELKYAIIRNGNMLIFKTEEECDTEMKPGDQKIEGTTKELQKRMLKLLEN